MNTLAVVLERAKHLNEKKEDLNRDFEVLLCHCLNKSRAWLFSHPKYFVTDLQEEKHCCDCMPGCVRKYLESGSNIKLFSGRWQRRSRLLGTFDPPLKLGFYDQ